MSQECYKSVWVTLEELDEMLERELIPGTKGDVTRVLQ
jgi:molybdenum-dependent DNA-binding transcriptional regulator ModE